MDVEFLGDWIEIRLPTKKLISIRKDSIIIFKELNEGKKTCIKTTLGEEYRVNMPYQEFKANMHINLNPSYEQRKNEAFEFFKK